MIAGGFDALTTWLDVLGFSLLGALTTEYNDDPSSASRPFDKDRSGFVLGEGAVVMVLEELEAARRAARRSMAELAGYGSSLNAYRMTDPPPDGGGAMLAMDARAEGGRAGAGGRRLRRRARHQHAGQRHVARRVAIKQVFGDARARSSRSRSPKSMTGHLTCGGRRR